MLNNKEVLERIENVLLDIADSTNDFNDYADKVGELMNNIADKTGLYRELIHLWLDEKLELKENDLKKIDDYLNIIENKKNCVNLSTAIAKRYIHIKFDLDDKFTNDFIENLRIHVNEEYEMNDNDRWLKKISIDIYKKEPIGIRDILFAMSYVNIEEEYDDILKKLMVYKAEQN